MSNPFGFPDLIIVPMLVAFIAAPTRMLRFTKLPVEKQAEFKDRARWIAVAALILLVVGRFVMLKLFPAFGRF